MVTQHMVKRVDLLQVYGDKDLPFIQNGFAQKTVKKISLLDEEIPVTLKNTYGGKYSVIQLAELAEGRGDNTGLIVPSEIVTQRTIPDAIDAYKPVLDEFFPGHWHFSTRHRQVFLHFPKVTITNGMQMKHTITDLVVIMEINQNYTIGTQLYGFRLTYSELELRKGYVHSHLNQAAYRVVTFCLGSRGFVEYLHSSNGRFINPRELAMVLSQIKRYVEWESLEGMPFISIKTLMSNQLSELDNPDIDLTSVAFTARGHQAHPTSMIWQKFVTNATLELVTNPKWDKLLVGADELGIILTTDNHHLLLDWELYVTEVYLHAVHGTRLPAQWFANYSRENNGYVVDESNNSRVYSWADIQRNLIAIKESYNDPKLFEKMGAPEPAIIEAEARPGGTMKTVPRLSWQLSSRLIRDVNTLLLNGFKDQLNERNNGSAQSESDNHSAARSASSVPA